MDKGKPAQLFAVLFAALFAAHHGSQKVICCCQL